MPDDFDYSKPRAKQANKTDHGRTPVTTVLLCSLCILSTFAHYLTRPGPDPFSQLGHFMDVSADDIWNGRYDGLVTCMFLHADFRGPGLIHILFNMMWLFQLGTFVELTIGPAWYILFVVAGAAVGSCVELAIAGTTGIGASGVVYALFGLMWAGRGRYPVWGAVANRDNMRMFIGWGLFCVVATYMGILSVANGAHAGGFLFGICVGNLCYPPRRRWIWAAPLVGLLALCALSLTYMPWSPEWAQWRDDRNATGHQSSRAIPTVESEARRMSGPPC
jgi:membrane associated rhomboid family serine protease